MPKTASRVRRPPPASETLQGLGDRLRRARVQAGLSQAQLGAPHFTRAYVSALELGKIRPAVKSLEFMADRLGKPVSYFLEDEERGRNRRERQLEVSEVAALLTRSRAATALQRAEELIESSTSPSELCTLHLYAGTALNFLGRGADALGQLTSAERMARELRNGSLVRAVEYQRAIAFRFAGDPAMTRQLLEELLTQVERDPVPDQVMRLKLAKDLGGMCYELGDLGAASAYLSSALSWANEIGDIDGLTSIYQSLAYAHRARGDLDTASGYLQKALGATEVTNDLTMTANLLNAAAVFAADRGHLEAAHRHVDRAIEIARVNGPPAFLPHYLNTKAECAVKGHDWETAKAFAAEALEGATTTGNGRAAAAARVVLAEVASHDNRHEEGVHQLEEAASAYRTLGARSELGEVLMRLSRLVQSRGLTDDAQRYATMAYEATRTPSGLVER